MIKNIISMLILSGVLQMYAMQNSMCYLAHMPSEIQKLIAYFLVCDDETVEEFIERTKKHVFVGRDYDRFLFSSRKISFDRYESYCNVGKILRKFSSDQTKIVFLKRFYGIENAYPLLVIVDREKNAVIMKDERFNRDGYEHIALASSARVFAAVRHCKVYESMQGRLNALKDKFLIMKNLETQTQMKIKIPHRDKIASIDFNKQDTHIIMHFKKQKLSNRACPDPVIFPLNSEGQRIMMPEKRENIEKITLQQYCMERQICKSIEGSK